MLEIWLTLGAVAALVGAFTPRAQRLGDLMAGTYSERTRAPALPPPAPGLPRRRSPSGRPSPTSRAFPIGSRGASRSSCAQAERMQPSARARIAASLAAEAAPFVSPLPAVDPETLLRGVIAVRRDRELRALQLEAQRVAALTARRRRARPRGFPQR